MARSDMTDFMTQDRREFVFGVEKGEKPSGNVDASTGEGEGIGFGHIDQLKLVGDVGAGRMIGEALTELGQVGLKAGVLDQTHFALDDLGQSISLFDLGTLAGQDGFGSSAHGISRTAPRANEKAKGQADHQASE